MKYWKSLEEYNNAEEKDNAHSPTEKRVKSVLKSDRRDFLKLFGFGVASAAVMASCERPVKKAIPLLIQPEEIRPGVSSFYASTYYNGGEAVPVLVKVRDGRPIKIEGNEQCQLTNGGTSAQVQASLLNLYDESRPKNPTFNGVEISWSDANRAIIEKLDSIPDDKDIIFLTHTIISPSIKLLIDKLAKKYPNIKVVILDSVSYSGLREAYREIVGVSAIPFYRFDKAKTIVSFGADFLGTWITPTTYTNQYVQNRKLQHSQQLSKHIQYESVLSLSGSNADDRYVIKPSEQYKYIRSLFNRIAELTNNPVLPRAGFEKEVEDSAQLLVKSKSESLVVASSNNKDVQLVVFGINQMLGSMGTTISLDNELKLYQGRDTDIFNFAKNCEDGAVGAVVCYDSNPAYNLPSSINFKELIKDIKLTINITSQNDETNPFCQFVLPLNHYLESWNDFEVASGMYSLSQPTIHPIFNSKDIHQILLPLVGEQVKTHDFIKEYWISNVIDNQVLENSFVTSWKKVLSNGVFYSEKKNVLKDKLLDTDLILNSVDESGGELEFQAYHSVALGDGKLANNPWLQELPDPVSKICWDNYFAVAPSLAQKNNWKQGDVIEIKGVQLPVCIQPGQHEDVIAAALGYGRTMLTPDPETIGKNVKHLLNNSSTGICYYASISNVKTTGITYELATTQMHHNMEGRALIRETSFNEYLKDAASGNEIHEIVEHHHTSLYKKHEFKGHYWAMFIDLNSCTGCNACVVACSAENNVPVVGRDEVRRSHEMHWLRIDRYYTQSPNDPSKISVVRQPVMCQHCDNAPCENVCPVAATNHSSEGINQMAYNRCIGTRYCNNNCPYKVRRFNWYDYTRGRFHTF